MSGRDSKAWEQLVGLDRRNPYVQAAAYLLAETGCTVRRWRRSLTGTAAITSSTWAIEAPKPTTARAFGVFAHEVGHQVLHRRGSRPRWLEEIEAWDYAIEQAGKLIGHSAAVDVADEAGQGVAYALGKAIRRGVKPSAFLLLPNAARWYRELAVASWGPDGRPTEQTKEVV